MPSKLSFYSYILIARKSNIDRSSIENNLISRIDHSNNSIFFGLISSEEKMKDLWRKSDTKNQWSQMRITVS